MHACTVILASSDHKKRGYDQYLRKCVTPVILLRNASVCLVASVPRAKDEPSADQVPAGDKPGRAAAAQRAAVPTLRFTYSTLTPLIASIIIITKQTLC